MLPCSSSQGAESRGQTGGFLLQLSGSRYKRLCVHPDAVCEGSASSLEKRGYAKGCVCMCVLAGGWGLLH